MDESAIIHVNRRGRPSSRTARSTRPARVMITREDHTAADEIVSHVFSEPVPPSSDPTIQALYAEHFPEEGQLYDFRPARSNLDALFALRDVSAGTEWCIYPVCPTKTDPKSNISRAEDLQGSNFLLETVRAPGEVSGTMTAQISGSASNIALFDLKILPEFSEIGWNQFGDGLERFANFLAVKGGDPGSLAIVLEPFQTLDKRYTTLAEAFMTAGFTRGNGVLTTIRDSGSLKSTKTASLGTAFVNVVFGEGDGERIRSKQPCEIRMGLHLFPKKVWESDEVTVDGGSSGSSTLLGSLKRKLTGNTS